MSDAPRDLTPAELIRLAELAARLSDDALADAEVAELESILAESPAAREAFAGFALLSADLRHAHGRFSVPVPSALRRRAPLSIFRAQWMPWVAAAVLTLAALVAWTLPTWRASAPGAEHAIVSNASGAALLRDDHPIVATVGTSLRGGLLELRRGLLELTYRTGVVIVIEAPARFDLRSPAALWLAEGNVSARVPPGAQGFIVETPSARILDLGTEFAVSAGATSSEVHVFSGEVLVTNASEPDSLRLTEHRATRIDTATRTPTGIDYQPERFIRSLEEPTSRYPELIRQLDPVAYYRMRITPEADRLVDVGPRQLHGRIVAGPGQCVSTPGWIGAGLRLGGAAARTYAVAPDFPKAPGSALTVCAWVRADSRPRWASIAKHWAKDRGSNAGGQFHFGLQHDDGELEVHVHDAAGREIGVRDSAPLPLGEWQFVAFTLDGAMLRLFRNGREVAAAPCTGLSANAPSALGIGVKLDASGAKPERNTPGFWDGALDELAVFHRPLTAAQILALYEAAPR